MGHNRQQQSRSSIEKPSPNDLKAIIQGGEVESARLTVKWAQSLGKALKDPLTSAQIRNIFGQVRQIEMNWPSDDSDPRHAEAAQRDLLLLKPKLEYQARRDSERGKHGVQELAAVLEPAIDLVIDPGQSGDSRANFQRFVDFFEAILAYHRAAGGK